MPFKPNYRMQRADRNRAKEEKLQKKLLRKAERGAQENADVPVVPEADVLDDTSETS